MKQERKILLLHHTPYHFETLLAFAETCRHAFDTSIWCFSLPDLNRGKLLKQLELQLHLPGTQYDHVIVLSGDEPGSYQGLDTELDTILASTPILNVMHQYHGVEHKASLYLFPTAPKPVIMARTGIPAGRGAVDNPEAPKQFLVQGHVDGRRRAYDRLPGLGSVERAIVNIVGGGMPENCPSAHNIHYHLRIDEISFHKKCSEMDFIIPLIDPDIHPQYFDYAFSSSVLIGLAYSLPFIAHERLFELYPIKGFSYSTYEGMKSCVEMAASLSHSDYVMLSNEVSNVQQHLQDANIFNLQTILSGQ